MVPPHPSPSTPRWTYLGSLVESWLSVSCLYWILSAFFLPSLARTLTSLAVTTVAGVVHVECLSQRTSKEGRYISVRIGPVWVENGDQVIAIYAELKRRGEELAHKGAGKLKYLI